jgi:nitroreductase
MTNATSRRELLRRAVALLGSGALGIGTGSGLLVSLPGCGIYEAEEGDAFSPWAFPGTETVPERVVARAALLASSPHNTQPWGLAVRPGAIELRARLDRNLGTMDSLLREMHIGLGCAIENMVVTSRALGQAAAVTLFPDPGDETLVARVALPPSTPTTAADKALFHAIAARHTNRGPYLETPASAALEAALRALIDDTAVEMHWLASPAERAFFREQTILATEAIVTDGPMSEDSYAWYRHDEDEIERHRDGTTIDATGNTAFTRTFGKALAKPSRSSADGYWLDGTRTRQTTASAYVLLSSTRANTRADQLRVGRVYQRMHLWATTQGLGMQPLNQLPERQDREETAALEPRFSRVLEGIVGPERRAQMAYRIGYPWDRAFASPRRPLDWVLT